MDSKDSRRSKSKRSQWLSKTVLIMVADALLIFFAFGFMLLMRFDFVYSEIPTDYIRGYLPACGPTIASSLLIMYWFGLYHSIWSYVSVAELVRLMESWLFESLLVALYSLVGPSMPVSFWVGGTALSFVLTSGLRFSWRLIRLLMRDTKDAKEYRRVLIVGAGESGRALIHEMEVTPELGMRAVCAIDDNPNKRGRNINGVPVVGNHDDIAAAVEQYHIDLIVVAMPSATGLQRKTIVEVCQDTGLDVRVVPGMYQLVDGKVSVSRLRQIKIEDLLGRDPVLVDGSGIHDLVAGRTVLVTGGGGSIGSEICRQVARDNPKRLIIFDIYENNAYAIQQELWRSCPGLDLVVLIGSVRDAERVRDVFATYRPDVVFHAAAHKHVPLMEDSPHEAIKNNVFGTLNCARAALEFGATRFVLISTDKAVNPTNVMGASKRLCEMIIQAEGRKAVRDGAVTTYSAVRFGNVLGSNGSVVPLFERQIAEGGPVTVTHPDIIRYFMTIPEAVSLVLQSACYAQGGEIFVLDMGDPVKIDDMARNLIRLAGYEPDVDIPIVYTGLRPGEKLYEERLMSEEGLRDTANHMISVARPMKLDDVALARDLSELAIALEDESSDIRTPLQRIVPTFQPRKGGRES